MGCALGKAKNQKENLVYWGRFVHGAELLKVVQNLLGILCDLCPSRLCFPRGAPLGLSLEEKICCYFYCNALGTMWHLTTFPGALFGGVSAGKVSQELRSFPWRRETAGP